jgi:hypothetical protein
MKQIKEMENIEDRDRLELVRQMRFVLGALAQSLSGWTQWMNNPDIVSKFNQDELREMNKTLSDFVKSFIEYDIRITNEGIQKGIQERRNTQKRSSQRVFYV